MAKFRVVITETTEKQHSKMDKQTVRVLKNWIIKNLVDSTDPTSKVKPLRKIKGYLEIPSWGLPTIGRYKGRSIDNILVGSRSQIKCI